MTTQASYSLTAVASAALLLVAAAAARPTTGVASKLQIAIHEQGVDPLTHGANPHGAFTIDLALPGFSASGKSVLAPDPGASKYVAGQQRIPFSGVDTFTSSKGQLEISFTGTHVPINARATSSGQTVGPAVESGTWRITTATGIYDGWKGGGPWAAAIYGYTIKPSYSVEWDGYITR